MIHIFRSPARPALAAGLLALALACVADSAAAQRNRAELLLSDRPAPRRGCTIAHDPDPLPGVDQLADSAMLDQRVTAFAQQYPIRDNAMFALYSIAFDANGAVERVQAVDYMLPQGHADELAVLVRSALKPQRSGRPWSVRLRLEPGATPKIRVGRSEVCAPEIRVRFTVTAPASSHLQSPPPMRLRVLVGDDGRVRSFQMLNGSGVPELDQWVQSRLVEGTYTPGLVDGVPVTAEREMSLPVRVR
jgi:hypothetical protein